MSIPPLVCSTPPPPDQCEDDKDPGDFDVQYNLSQDEDDEENYDFGSFATYDHFQSAKSKNNVKIITNVVEDETVNSDSKESPNGIEIVLGTKITIEDKLNFEESLSIEDLNLEVDDVKLENTDFTVELSPVESKDKPFVDNIDQILETQTATNVSSSPENVSTCHVNLDSPPQSEQCLESSNLEQFTEEPTNADEIVANPDDIFSEPQSFSKVSEDVANYSETLPQLEQQSECKIKDKQSVDKDDDFGDFEDFQFANHVKTTATVIETCENPWNNEKTDDDFKANFDTTEISSNDPDFKTVHSTEIPTHKDTTESLEDDDFGDFNDFKSSGNSTDPNQPQEEISETEYQTMLDTYPVLDIDSFKTEAELMAYINNEINELYEIAEEEEAEEFNGNLESILGVTWGHLLEVETRQPYMVNWNSSLGQQTLLKALCIDSRNILFGPKWNNNMPKFAANLSVAPLQPLKPIATTITSNESVNTEKVSNKTSTWSDPFASTGQESCTADPANENPVVIETGPTDLDVFEASTSKKNDKIFSSTISVQPLRQISLPDTHIFTPTDSETPRSTTIHYDSTPPILLPHSVLESSKTEPVSLTPHTSLQTPADDDYWEFQNFKGATDIAAIPSTSKQAVKSAEMGQTNPNISYGTQVLQPIKIEPIMPTLNWPDPGEVKETFDDFSDFVSNSSLSNQQDIPVAAVQHMDGKSPSAEFDIAGPKSQEMLPNEPVNNVEDDFDTFQSAALPSTSANVDFGFTHLTPNVTTEKPSVLIQSESEILTDFNKAFQKDDNVKSDTISLATTTRTNANPVQNHTSFYQSNLEYNKASETVTRNPATHIPTMLTLNTNVLQPTPVSSSTIIQNQQKSTQILQPLSLESYSQINWPNPGIDLQDLSRFNPVETLHSLKTDLSANSLNKVASPAHSQKSTSNNQADDDIWGEFVSSQPKPQQQAMPKKPTTFVDDDEWTDFVSSPNVKPQNGLNTISLNVHTNLNIKKTNLSKGKVKNNQLPLDIPTLNYITPKSSAQKAYNDRHFQNL